ncbi:MAG TPA: class I SAM-dependent methyltransferase [Thermoanaerobaculia bacterium]|nr:class I SAM-dependent methyltransferase [Thermoanaerobaculia bacterium]
MTEPFGPAYASAYDVFYAGKDYALEVALIEECFARYSAIPVVSVLDLGCGTGSHARLLAAHGFAVTGVDRSGEMLELARAKSAGSPHAIEWIQADLRDLQLNRRYDAATLMFAVLGGRTCVTSAPSPIARSMPMRRLRTRPSCTWPFTTMSTWR